MSAGVWYTEIVRLRGWCSHLTYLHCEHECFTHHTTDPQGVHLLRMPIWRRKRSHLNGSSVPADVRPCRNYRSTGRFRLLDCHTACSLRILGTTGLQALSASMKNRLGYPHPQRSSDNVLSTNELYPRSAVNRHPTHSIGHTSSRSTVR